MYACECSDEQLLTYGMSALCDRCRAEYDELRAAMDADQQEVTTDAA